jgi:hypothetical protein
MISSGPSKHLPPNTAPQLLALIATLMLGAAPSDVFVDAGACPGEGCVYGERWTARDSLELRAEARDSAEVVATLAPGDPVKTVTGEVHTRPGRFVVTRARDGFAPGDVLLLYTYIGEGWYRARHGGELVRVDLGFGPRGRRCRTRDAEGCWGVLERPPESRWWVKLRTTAGVEGWTLDSLALEKPSAH